MHETRKGGHDMSRPHEDTEQGDWRFVFCGEYLVTAFNVLHMIHDGASVERGRETHSSMYGYSWSALKNLLIELFGDLSAFLDPDNGRHSRLASEMYPPEIRALHNFMKENIRTAFVNDVNVRHILCSTAIWPDRNLPSLQKRRFLYEILMALHEGRLDPRTFKLT
jgi:hypothetical protein